MCVESNLTSTWQQVINIERVSLRILYEGVKVLNVLDKGGRGSAKVLYKEVALFPGRKRWSRREGLVSAVQARL